MNNDTVKKIVALGSVTGMRSMAGIAALAVGHRGVARSVTGAAAVGEMIADKTPWVGDRIDALPLTGRAVMGAAVGALIAVQQNENPVIGGMLGAATALIVAHLAYHVRKRLPLSTVAAGLLEDGVVMAISARHV